MKLQNLVVALLLLAGVAFAQDATVVELSQTDAQQAKQLYAEKIAADKAWDEAYKRIETKYPVPSEGYASIHGPDIEFSTDFRFIVPKPYALLNSVVIGSSNSIYPGIYPYCGSFITPTSGTFSTPLSSTCGTACGVSVSPASGGPVNIGSSLTISDLAETVR